jgi:hypothetical protein
MFIAVGLLFINAASALAVAPPVFSDINVELANSSSKAKSSGRYVLVYVTTKTRYPPVVLVDSVMTDEDVQGAIAKDFVFMESREMGNVSYEQWIPFYARLLGDEKSTNSTIWPALIVVDNSGHCVSRTIPDLGRTTPAAVKSHILQYLQEQLKWKADHDAAISQMPNPYPCEGVK